jgi:hypothetical protein
MRRVKTMRATRFNLFLLFHFIGNYWIKKVTKRVTERVTMSAQPFLTCIPKGSQSRSKAPSALVLPRFASVLELAALWFCIVFLNSSGLFLCNNVDQQVRIEHACGNAQHLLHDGSNRAKSKISHVPKLYLLEPRSVDWARK